MSRAPEYDWEYIRHKYISGDMTLADLAQGDTTPAYDTIRARAAREEWSRQREEYRHRTATQARTLASDEQATVAAQQAGVGRSLVGIGLTRLRGIDPEELTVDEARRIIALGLITQREALGLGQADRDTGILDEIALALRAPVEPREASEPN